MSPWLSSATTAGRSGSSKSASIMRCKSWVLPWPVPATMCVCSKRAAFGMTNGIENVEQGLEGRVREIELGDLARGSRVLFGADALAILEGAL